MTILDNDIKRFKELYVKRFGFSISNEQAKEKLHKLVRQVEIIQGVDDKKLRLRKSNGSKRFTTSSEIL